MTRTVEILSPLPQASRVLPAKAEWGLPCQRKIQGFVCDRIYSAAAVELGAEVGQCGMHNRAGQVKRASKKGVQ